MLTPPRPEYYGDIEKASTLKGAALAFYQLVCSSMGEVQTIRREKRNDTTVIQATIWTAYGEKRGVVKIYVAPVGGEQEPRCFITYTDWKGELNDPLIIPAPPYTWNHRDRFVHKSRSLITVEPPPLVPPNRLMDLPRFDPVVKTEFYAGGGRNQSSQDGYWISNENLAVSWQGRYIFIKGLRYEADFLTDSNISTNSKLIVACAIRKKSLLVVVWNLKATGVQDTLTLYKLSYSLTDIEFTATVDSSRDFFTYKNSIIGFEGLSKSFQFPYCCFLSKSNIFIINTIYVPLPVGQAENPEPGTIISDKFCYEIIFNDDFSSQDEKDISIPVLIPTGVQGHAVFSNSFKNNFFLLTSMPVSHETGTSTYVNEYLSYIYEDGVVSRHNPDIKMEFTYNGTLQNYAFPFLCSKNVFIVAKWDISNSSRGWLEIHNGSDTAITVEGVLFPEVIINSGLIPTLLNAFDGVMLIIASQYGSYIINAGTGELQTLDYDVSSSGVVGEYYQVSVTNVK